MNAPMVDVVLHLDEEISHDDREKFRDTLLKMNGVMAASSHDEKPHLIVIEYNPDILKSSEFVDAAQANGLHAELVGL
ncbi:ATP-binding protein [Sulfuriflexus sp.]|uniref:ATP-binding protein n=1 Tax=Sulfuriflexus sp. TaxID=2015443 RepID=UPI0028CCA225|nr:ATP-binding protein [Sulfuriflexus sp.]MDT8404963.1 ATP-binding protein [Sulfuriflexus sp.]